MAWKGFLIESKLYMGYPGHYQKGWVDDFPNDSCLTLSEASWKKQVLRRKQMKIRFWMAFPRAFMKFHYYTLCDWVHGFMLKRRSVSSK